MVGTAKNRFIGASSEERISQTWKNLQNQEHFYLSPTLAAEKESNMVTEAPTVRGQRRQLTNPKESQTFSILLSLFFFFAECHRPWVWWRGRTWSSLSSWDQAQGSNRQPAWDKFFLSSIQREENDQWWSLININDHLLRGNLWPDSPGCHVWGRHPLAALSSHLCRAPWLRPDQVVGYNAEKHFTLLTLPLCEFVHLSGLSHLCCDLHWLESCLCPWFSHLLNLHSKSLNLEGKN